MEPTQSSETTGSTAAHCIPLAIFLLLLGVLDILPAPSATSPSPWYVDHPRHWLFPLQTFVCLGFLLYFWRNYEFRPHRGWVLAAGTGLFGILIWILPGRVYEAWQPGEGARG